jgi:hypothetical protein
MRHFLILPALLLFLAAAAAFGDNGNPKAKEQPEPSEWAMLFSGLGMVALGLSRKPRRDAGIPRES